jgi:hypothetical protein
MSWLPTTPNLLHGVERLLLLFQVRSCYVCYQSSSAQFQRAPPHVVEVNLLICIKGTPAFSMSLSRSPSPRTEGGWSSPGLTTYTDGTDKARQSSSSGNNVTWAGAKKKSELVNGGHMPFPKNTGFFKRHMRSLSNSLPSFNIGEDYSYAEKEKLGRGRWSAKDGSIISRARYPVIQFVQKSRLRAMIILSVLLLFILYMFTRTFQNLNFQPLLTLDSHTILVAQGALVRRR